MCLFDFYQVHTYYFQLSEPRKVLGEEFAGSFPVARCANSKIEGELNIAYASQQPQWNTLAKLPQGLLAVEVEYMGGVETRKRLDVYLLTDPGEV